MSLSALTSAVGCSSCESSKDSKPTCGERRCSAAIPTNSPRGLTADKKVDVTALQAWPNRQVPEPQLTAQQQADACALISACELDPTSGKPLDDASMEALTQACAKGKGPGDLKEERAIPQQGQNERFTFQALAVLNGPVPHDCAFIRAQATQRPSEIVCQEDGCWWDSPTPAPPACCRSVPAVTCAGNVATLTTDDGVKYTRDCARAYAKCDPSSSTGCTDRAPVACDPAALDKCEKDVKLGCDGEGRVSFHDCARYPGGHCSEDATGVKCLVDDEKCKASELGCSATQPDILNVCVAGATVPVDCGALGMGPCSKGHCTPK